MRARSGARMKYWYSTDSDPDVEIKIVQFVYVLYFVLGSST